MKKIYFLFAVVLATSAISAQKHASELGKKNKIKKLMQKQNLKVLKRKLLNQKQRKNNF